MNRYTLQLTLIVLPFLLLQDAQAQRRGGRGTAEPEARAQGPLKDIHWRSIGPFRGGRVLAVAGSSSQPQTYYFGGTGGGIWKTTDGGFTWIPVSDGQLASRPVGGIAGGACASHPGHAR